MAAKDLSGASSWPLSALLAARFLRSSPAASVALVPPPLLLLCELIWMGMTRRALEVVELTAPLALDTLLPPTLPDGFSPPRLRDTSPGTPRVVAAPPGAAALAAFGARQALAAFGARQVGCWDAGMAALS